MSDDATCVFSQQRINDIFKFTVDTYAFSGCMKFSPSWIEQILCMNEYWDTLLDSFNLQNFYHLFKSHCEELELPYQSYSLFDGFKKAKSTWRIELMLQVCSRISHMYTDGYFQGESPVYWCDKGQRVQLRYQLQTRSHIDNCFLTLL